MFVRTRNGQMLWHPGPLFVVVGFSLGNSDVFFQSMINKVVVRLRGVMRFFVLRSADRFDEVLS